MTFDYDRDTRQHYQSPEIARAYHAAFAAGRSWRTLASRVVAARERAVVAQFLRRVPHRRVLDLPAGTGKLAPVLAPLGAAVVACDLAPPMLAIARTEYTRAGVHDAVFRICDAEQINATLGERFEVAICLRLLHRVPGAVRARVLAELAAAAGHTILSMGVETPYHRARRRLRARVLGGSTSALCYAGRDAIRSQLTAHFEILGERWILPGLSQEMIFLLRPRG